MKAAAPLPLLAAVLGGSLVYEIPLETRILEHDSAREASYVLWHPPRGLSVHVNRR